MPMKPTDPLESAFWERTPFEVVEPNEDLRRKIPDYLFQTREQGSGISESEEGGNRGRAEAEFPRIQLTGGTRLQVEVTNMVSGTHCVMWFRLLHARKVGTNWPLGGTFLVFP
jgi:hypothetical protein